MMICLRNHYGKKDIVCFFYNSILPKKGPME